MSEEEISQLPVMLAKRDIKSAFRLIRLHPLMAKVMGTEMRGHHFGLSGDVVVFYGVLPFGWGSSPSRFVRFSDALTKLHQLTGPADPSWNLPFAFRSSMFIDGGLFIELRIGDRRRRSVLEWEGLARGLLSQDAINTDKEREEGEWQEEQIFLGFRINTVTMSISLPEEKKAGATILFDELFSSFGNRVLRLVTLQRLRGDIEHFRTTNLLWSFFTGPIDILMCCADESNVWINCGSRHVRYAFWNAMDIIRIIRRNEISWSSLFVGQLERLLPPEQRFACAQRPANIAWISAGATLGRIAGISWEDKEVFVFDAARLVRQFKRAEEEDIIIGECELIVVLISVLLWHERNQKKRTLIVCTDNMNVFSWLNKWRAKSGTANTLLKALIDFLAEKGIEIIPRYVRSEDNIAADYLTRCTDGNILEWAEQNKMQRIWMPKEWFGMVDKWKPEVDFSMLVRFDIPLVLERAGSRIVCCEWRPSVYGLSALVEKYGGNALVYEPPHSSVLTAIKSVTEWANETVILLGGMVWGEYEMVDFVFAIEAMQPLVAVAITPYAFKEPESVSPMWDEAMVVDAALYGPILNQRWEIYAWGPFETAFLHLDVQRQYKRVLADGYCDVGLSPQQDDEGLMRIVPFDVLSGVTVTIRAAEETRYSLNSHIPQLTLNELWTGTTLWPRKRDGEEIDSVGKILILGGHKDWSRLRRSNAAALIGSLIRVGPVEIWKRVVYATLTSSMGVEEIEEEMEEQQQLPIPTSRKKGGNKGLDWTYSEEGDGRAGGKSEGGGEDEPQISENERRMGVESEREREERYEYGESEVRDFFRTKNELVYGSGKVDDLLSGAAESTRSAHKTAWAQWSHFNAHHPAGVWIEEYFPKWGERIIDWILF